MRARGSRPSERSALEGGAPGAAPPPGVVDVWDRLATRAPAAGWGALMRAGRRVLATWSGGDVPAAEVEEPLLRIADAVGDALAGAPVTIAHSQALVPLRPLLDRLRAAFLAEVATDASAREELLAVLGAIEVVQDALAEDSAQRLAQRLAEADALELVVEVAHDMRSPLTSILFLAERLKRAQSGTINPVQERQLGLIYSAAFGLSSLASDVMELARGGDRLIGREPLPFSVMEILQSVRDIVQPIAEEKGLQLRFQALDTDWRVGYPAALNRVLLNLTTNALKFTAEGHVDVVLQPTSRNGVTVEVSDTGRGIPAHVLETLFDSFRRRQQPGGEYAFSSAGLGLSIVRKLVRLMGSELRVETALEQGTRFSFELELPPARRL